MGGGRGGGRMFGGGEDEGEGVSGSPGREGRWIEDEIVMGDR